MLERQRQVCHLNQVLLGDDGLPIVLFDGFCSTCNRWAQWISKRDSNHVFELIAQDSPEGDNVMSQCPEKLRLVDSVYIVNGDSWHVRSSAVCRMLWGLGIHWRIIGTLLWLIPRPLRDMGYNIFAKRRHRMVPLDS